MIKIEVWSDVSCPFCWLGKARLDAAISAAQIPAEVVMRSFQLNPDIQTDPDTSLFDYLHRTRGYPPDQVRQINIRLSESGRASGLEFNFEKVIVANTMKAHNLIKYASRLGGSNSVTNALFHSYFSEGKNVDDPSILEQIAEQNGLDKIDFRNAVSERRHHTEIMADIAEASSLNVRGVPFFVFNRKFAISGAQEQSVFEKALIDLAAS